MKSDRRERRQYLALAVLSPLALLGLWYLATREGWVRSVLLPSPQAVLASIVSISSEGYSGVSIWAHVGASVGRVLTAFIAGSALGVSLGILRGRSPRVDAALVVPTEMLRPLPPLGLIPLFILWFGIGELSKVLLIFTAVFLIMMVNAQAGTRSCPPDLTRAALSLGANSAHLFRYVVLPAALPQIMTGLRISMGTGLSILVASELLGGDRGLGFIILDASNFFRTTYVFAGIFLIGLIGLVSDRTLALLTRKVVHWEGRR